MNPHSLLLPCLTASLSGVPMSIRTLLREGRMAPPFASTKASLAEQRMRSNVLLVPVHSSSNKGPVILKVDLRDKFSWCTTWLQVNMKRRDLSHLLVLCVGHNLNQCGLAGSQHWQPRVSPIVVSGGDMEAVRSHVVVWTN